MSTRGKKGATKRKYNGLPSSQGENNEHLQASEGNSPKPKFVQIASVSYENLLVGIFADSSEKNNPSRFFFEPIVLLDPKSISSQTNHLFKQDLVHFSIKMWNSELRSKILDRLRSLPNFKNQEIHEEDIYVMPYQEVQLVLKPGSNMDLKSIKLMDTSIPFHPCYSNLLDFYLICDSRTTADILADNLRKHPEFFLQNWKLALECRGFMLDQDVISERVATINVSSASLPQEIADSNDIKTKEPFGLSCLVKALANNGCVDRQLLCKDVTDWMSAMVSYKKWAVSVVSVMKILPGKGSSSRQHLVYSIVMAPNTNGEFDISKGTFTVKTPGIYLFHISGYYNFTQRESESGSIQLRVNNQQVSSQSVTNQFYDTEPNEDSSVDFEQDTMPIVLSSFVSLKTGDKVNSFSEDLLLIEREDVFTTRFSCVYFPD